MMRELIAVLVKKTEQKFGGPSLAEFANDPPLRKHYVVADAILREFDVTPHTEDMGPAANCHLCVGAGGYEDHEGEWVECSCQRPTQGEPSDAPTPEEWRERINAERLRQAEHGYDRPHDDRHGVGHLLTWAQDYARRGKAIASAALVEAAREVLSRAVPSAAIRRLEEEISQPDVDLAIEGKAYVTVDAKDIHEILAALRAASAVTEQGEIR